VGPDDLARNALAELAVQCCRRDAFHTLRTVEQLGYMVWLAGVPTLTVRAVAFVVQSSAFSAEHLEARCEAFVTAQLARLAELDADSFASQARTLPQSLPGMLHAGGAGTSLFLLTFAFSYPRRGPEHEPMLFLEVTGCFCTKRMSQHDDGTARLQNAGHDAKKGVCARISVMVLKGDDYGTARIASGSMHPLLHLSLSLFCGMTHLLPCIHGVNNCTLKNRPRLPDVQIFRACSNPRIHLMASSESAWASSSAVNSSFFLE
jgi:hypothetical protein